MLRVGVQVLGHINPYGFWFALVETLAWNVVKVHPPASHVIMNLWSPENGACRTQHWDPVRTLARCLRWTVSGGLT